MRNKRDIFSLIGLLVLVGYLLLLWCTRASAIPQPEPPRVYERGQPITQELLNELAESLPEWIRQYLLDGGNAITVAAQESLVVKGEIFVPDPTESYHAATKQYVDDNSGGVGGSGTTVTANPSGNDGDDLERIRIAGTNYNVAEGAQGIQGIAGADGTDGADGAAGAAGADGDDGMQGIQGIEGTMGADGAQGIGGC